MRMFCDIWFKPELQAYLQIFRAAAVVEDSGQYSFVIERARDRLAILFSGCAKVRAPLPQFFTFKFIFSFASTFLFIIRFSFILIFIPYSHSYAH